MRHLALPSLVAVGHMVQHVFHDLATRHHALPSLFAPQEAVSDLPSLALVSVQHEHQLPLDPPASLRVPARLSRLAPVGSRSPSIVTCHTRWVHPLVHGYLVRLLGSRKSLEHNLHHAALHHTPHMRAALVLLQEVVPP